MERGCSLKNFCFWATTTLLLGLCCLSIYQIDITGKSKNLDEVVTTIFHDAASSQYLKDAYLSSLSISQKAQEEFR